MKMNKKLIPYVLMASLTVGSLMADPIAYADLMKKEKTSGISVSRVYEALRHEKDDYKSKAIRGSVSLKDTLALLEIIKGDGSGVTTADQSEEKATVTDIAARLVKHRDALNALVAPFKGTAYEEALAVGNVYVILESFKAVIEGQKLDPSRYDKVKAFALKHGWTNRTWAEYGSTLLIFALAAKAGVFSTAWSWAGSGLSYVTPLFGKTKEVASRLQMPIAPAAPAKTGWFGKGSK